MTQSDILERLRLHYKPSRVSLLLVGESPPRLKGFFYDTTVPEGQLSRNTRKAFQDHYKKPLAGRDEFLAQFKTRGCYIVDLFQQRGKTIDTTDKREKQAAIRELTNTLIEEQPKTVASVLQRIREPVDQAIIESNLAITNKPLYYPTRQYIPRYKSGLQAILSEL